MSTSTEAKPSTNEQNDVDKDYSVEEYESETDKFSKAKTNFLRTPSVLNKIINQIHPEVIAKLVAYIFCLV